MKKLIFLLLASFLVISACGQKEESKSEETKKATEDKKEKDNKKKDSEKKKNDKKDKEKPDKNSENEESEEIQQQDTTNQEGENQQQKVQQSNAQQQIDEQANQQADEHQQPLTQEQMEANAKVAKQHGYTGIPNGDAGMIDYDEVDRILEENRQEAENSRSNGPRSLREIKEDTGRGASEFTQEEIDEANAYAREH